MGMSCGAKCAQILLVVINFVVFLCGIAVIGVAVALKFATEDMIGWLVDIVGTYVDWGVLAGAFYVMLGVGVFLLLVGFFGCCGAIKRYKCLLGMYIFVVVGILLLQVTGGILVAVFLGYLDETVETGMQENVQNSYGMAGGITTSWDNMQYEIHCCGGSDYKDYQDSSYYSSTKNIVPKSCCTEATRDGSSIILDDAAWSTCKADVTAGLESSGSFHTQGCYTSLNEWISSYTDVLLGVMIGLGVFQIVSIVMACCVLKQDKYESYA